jgi:hypothetical protein
MKYNTTCDDDNPRYMFQTMPTRLIQAIASGDVDAIEWAVKELESRGVK